MKIQVIVLIVFIFLLVGCQSNIENSRPDDDPRDNVIDYELLESIHAIQEILRNNAGVPINNELINLSTKLSSDDQPAFYLDEERLRMLNEH